MQLRNLLKIIFINLVIYAQDQTFNQADVINLVFIFHMLQPRMVPINHRQVHTALALHRCRALYPAAECLPTAHAQLQLQSNRGSKLKAIQYTNNYLVYKSYPFICLDFFFCYLFIDFHFVWLAEKSSERLKVKYLPLACNNVKMLYDSIFSLAIFYWICGLFSWLLFLLSCCWARKNESSKMLKRR